MDGRYRIGDFDCLATLGEKEVCWENSRVPELHMPMRVPATASEGHRGAAGEQHPEVDTHIGFASVLTEFVTASVFLEDVGSSKSSSAS